MSQQDRPWTLMNGKDVYGPYTSDEMSAYCKEGRVIGESLVRHPQLTLGNWKQASAIPFLAQYFPPVPPVAPPVHAEEPEFNPFAVPRKPVYKKRNRVEDLSFVEIVGAFFDPSFRYHLTPLIAKFTWITVVFWLILLVTVRSLAYAGSLIPLQVNQDEFSFEQVHPLVTLGKSISTIFSTIEYGFYLLIFYAVIWTRVVLETAISLQRDRAS